MNAEMVILWITFAVMIIVSVVFGAGIWMDYPDPSSIPTHLIGSAAVVLTNVVFLWYIVKVNSGYRE